MKSSILLLALISVVAFSSCTSAYKTGQTPDDVYYSPARPEDEYVQVEKKENRRYRNSEEYYEDRYLRMKVRDRYRWSDLDDWYYDGYRYRYVYYDNYLYNPWTPYTYWNCHYNPYYSHGVVIISPKSPTYSAPRTFNLKTYNNNSITNSTYSNPKVRSNTSTGPRNVYTPSANNNNNSGRNAGNILRNIFNSGNDNSSSSGTRTTTTTSSSSSSSGSSSGSSGSGGGGSAPVRKF